jgi:hypothetical protein
MKNWNKIIRVLAILLLVSISYMGYSQSFNVFGATNSDCPGNTGSFRLQYYSVPSNLASGKVRIQISGPVSITRNYTGSNILVSETITGLPTGSYTITFYENTEFSDAINSTSISIGCNDPCAGVVANWTDTGNTRCNGNASEKEQRDINSGCTGNTTNRWVVVDPMGCYVDPCAGVTASWTDTGNTRCNGNASEKEQRDTNSGCTGNTTNRWVVVDPMGCYVDPCAGKLPNWIDTGETRCNGNASEKKQHDNEACTSLGDRWVVVDPMGCYVNPCAGVVASWTDTGNTRCNGNASEKEQRDTNSGCTGNTTNRWVVVDPLGCAGSPTFSISNVLKSDCPGNTGSFILQYNSVPSNLASGKVRIQISGPVSITRNYTGANILVNETISSLPSGSYTVEFFENTEFSDAINSTSISIGCNDPCAGVVANWTDTGNTRCNGNASEKEQTDIHSGCTNNTTNRWVVVDPMGCYVNPCAGVVASWTDTGNTRCNGNASEKEQTDTNSGCTGNTTNRWVVVDPMGCYLNPCAGVLANWTDTGNTRCNGNASEKEQTDTNSGCTGNTTNRWVVVDPMGCYVNPCAGVVASWTDTGNTRCNGNASEKEQTDINSGCTGNTTNRWVVVDPMGCYVNPCAGVVASWTDTGNTRCNGNASEKEQRDVNSGCTGNTTNRWVVVDPMGCYVNPCAGVVASWTDTGNTRCNGNASEKEQRDTNSGCTGNTINRWVVVDPNGCNPCNGVVSEWVPTGTYRCEGNNKQQEQYDKNAGCTKNTYKRWITLEQHSCLPPTLQISSNHYGANLNDYADSAAVCFGEKVSVLATIDQQTNNTGFEWQIVSQGDTVSLIAGRQLDQIIEKPSNYYFRTRSVDDRWGIKGQWSNFMFVKQNRNPLKPIVDNVEVCAGKPIIIMARGEGHLSIEIDSLKLIGISKNSEGTTFNLKAEEPGIYEYKITSELSGCYANQSVKVKVNSTPKKLDLIAENNIIPYNSSTKIRAIGNEGTVLWSTKQKGEEILVKPFKTTTYTASCISTFGCQGEESKVQIGVLPETLKVIGQRIKLDGTEEKSENLKVCMGDYVKLNATNNCSGTIEWSNSDNEVFVPGNNGVLTFKPNTYRARCKNDVGFSAYSNEIKVELKPVAIVEDSIIVYPNPTLNKVNIRVNTCPKSIRIKLYTIFGQELFDGLGTSFDGDEIVLTLDRLPPEQYVVQVIDELGNVVGVRIIKALDYKR